MAEQSNSLAALKSELSALGFSGAEIDECFRDGNTNGSELSRRLAEVLELQRSIQRQEQHTKTVLQADEALRTAEYQLFGKTCNACDSLIIC